MYGGMDNRFEGNFPFVMHPWKLGTGRKLVQKLSHKSSDQNVIPVTLGPINEVMQRNGSDCVGAAVMSVFSEITGASITPELYEGFLQTALKHRLTERDSEGIKVLPFVLNVFSTPEFKQKFPSSDITVAYRRTLSLAEMSDIIKTTKNKTNPSYKLFVFLPFSSWTRADGGHMVTLQEINSTETTIYDPKIGEKRILPNAEFNRRWEHDNKSAIFVFVK